MTHIREGAGVVRPDSSNSAPAKASARANGTDTGVGLLLSVLNRVTKVRMPWPAWSGLCPCHDDTKKPNLLIEYKRRRDDGWPEVLVYCQVCRASLPAVCEAAGIPMWKVKANNESLDALIGNCESDPAPLPSPADVAHFQRRLWDDPELLRYLRDVRGLNDDTIKRYRIGHDAFYFTLPVFNGNGRIINLRSYLRDARDDETKIKGLFRRSIQLYPARPYNDARFPFVILCEGEWDALVCRSHELLAVTSTGGVKGWNDEWTELFTSLNVAVIFDCDAEAQKEALRRAVVLGQVAAAVKVVDLGLGHKEDLTDWFVAHRRSRADLLALIKSTPEVTP